MASFTEIAIKKSGTSDTVLEHREDVQQVEYTMKLNQAADATCRACPLDIR